MRPFSVRLFSGFFRTGNKAAAAVGRYRKLPGRARFRLCFAVVFLPLIFIAQAAMSASFPGSSGIPAPPDSQATFETWLNATGRPVYSRIHAYRADYPTYRDYKMLVYGSPGQVSGNRYDKPTSQYAYLGYSYDEIVVTNSLFRDDSPGGVTNSNPRQWKELDMGQTARVSWARLNEREKQYIKSSVLTYRNNSYGGMTFSELGLTEKNTVVLAQPSWHLGFALYTTHYRPGSSSDKRYATFNGEGAGSVSLAGSISVLSPADGDGCHVIRSTEDAIDLVYEISGRITAFSGLAAAGDLKACGAGNDDGWTNGSGTGPWTRQLTLRVSRSDLQAVSTKQIVLKGQVWAVSQMGDIQLLNMEKPVIIRAEETRLPLTVTADIRGCIHYFSGQTDSQGRTMPIAPHRFLSLERVRVTMDFSRSPSRIELTFLGSTRVINGQAGITHYEDSFIMPVHASTIDWAGVRKAPPLTLKITGWEIMLTPIMTQTSIGDIDLTGSVYDIAYVQTR